MSDNTNDNAQMLELLLQIKEQLALHENKMENLAVDITNRKHNPYTEKEGEEEDDVGVKSCV